MRLSKGEDGARVVSQRTTSIKEKGQDENGQSASDPGYKSVNMTRCRADKPVGLWDNIITVFINRRRSAKERDK